VKIRLSGGVVASGLCAWVPGWSGPERLVAGPAVPLGEPVALGPEGAREDEVARAVDALARLVSAGGAVAAGAGVDLGAGFRSARLAGARGDQRDAVLAALRVLGVEQAGRLGDRAGFLVALFGAGATKPVGAAATRAITEDRWAAVHLASAASDMLGPEQLERVLALRPPAGVDLVQGPASALAQHLRRVLEPVPGPRRLELLVDLWAEVIAHHAGLARRERLRATQSRRDRVEDLRKRRQHDDDRVIMSLLPSWLTEPEPALAGIARWRPPDHYWRGRLDRLVADALAATALLRAAAAVADHGLVDGLTRSAGLLAAAEAMLPASIADAAARKVPGLTGLPSRPGVYVRDIGRRLAAGGPRDHRFAGFVQPRLACARDFALVIMEDLEALLERGHTNVAEWVLRQWASSNLRAWRKDAGYSVARPPAGWGGIPWWPNHFLGQLEPLSQRLAAAPGQDALDVEVAGDLLWYAELADALAGLYGHDAARGPLGQGLWFDHNPAPEAEPLRQRQDSITVAVAGAAQLFALGATPPRHARTWREFADGLAASVSVTEAMTGEFRVPAPLAALDGTTVAGTGLSFRVARSARTLAGWSDYMANCIAGEPYLDRARAGRSVLTGLYGKDGVLIVNAELIPRRPVARGWRVGEIKARYNQAPDTTLERRFREWVEAVPGPAAGEAAPASPGEAPLDQALPGEARPGQPLPGRAAGRRRPVPRLVEDAGPALSAHARRAWETEVDGAVIGAFAALAGTAPDAALIRLRRLRPGSLTDTCRRGLDAGTVSLDRLWSATAVRPLRTAVTALDPALRDRFDQLPLLFSEPPLAKSLRRLVRLPAVDAAYALDRAALEVRRAIGALAVQDDPVIARALAARPAEPLLCALAVTVTCSAPEGDLVTVAPPRTVAVPGYPATALDDEGGPWQRAFPDARELGADTAAFWDQVAEHGLRVPASWLAGGAWTVLWARAHK
jgi:hypothetical protein